MGIRTVHLRHIKPRPSLHLKGFFMPFWKSNSAARDALAQSAAISKSQAVIEFKMDGTIITANQNFLDAMGYRLDEIQGKHHQMFAPPDLRGSEAYKAFWASLNRGEFQAAEYKRIGKGGREVWIQASYNPILDDAGRPVKVIKFATDITEKKIRSMEDAGKISAIGRAQAVIEFNLDGTIITANENFLATVGYRLDEIQGKHHSMFVAPGERDSAAYREFWAKLGRGEFQSAEYKRFGKGGKEVWILASYNPILDDAGKPFKVVKFATDVTADKLKAAELRRADRGDRQIAGGDRVQHGRPCADGQREFPWRARLFARRDQGQASQPVRAARSARSEAYRAFWANLNRGEFQSGEYERVGKGGKQIWIQASYNPIRDLNGKPFKVVKYASDTTAQVLARMRSEKVRGMMELVAAGAEELNASVREISAAMSKSRDTALTAVDRVEAADQQAQRLSEAAESMSSIVQLIGDITGQINLLALNATIESARAGEAGRGFAVVASEVKNLANQAKQATDKIEQEIGNLNGISGDVVGALGSIKKAIQEVSEYVTSTAAAVEEQSTVTSEMSNGMQQAAAEAASIGQAA